MDKVYDLVNKQFERMYKTGKLFRSKVSGEELWNAYLGGFVNPKVFRDPSSNEYNCNTCHAWFRHYANIVAIDSNNSLMTLFDLLPDQEYIPSFDACKLLLSKNPVEEVFIETFQHLDHLSYKKEKNFAYLGIPKNVKIYTHDEAIKFGVVTEGRAYTFEHYHLLCPNEFIKKTYESIESLQAYPRTSKHLLKRALDEISLDTLELVRDLIGQDSLLDGKAHLEKVKTMITLAKEYKTMPEKEKDNWCWRHYDSPVSRFKNELIGVLCTELAEGKELNEACKAWNYRVDPVNYMKAVAPITQKQIDEAMKYVQENGYEESFKRRCARLDDIKADEILHINSGDGTVKPVSVFDSIQPTSTRHKRSEFDGVQEIPVDKFFSDILPTCKSVELYMTGALKKNLVSLTTSDNKDSKNIFKWNNNFSWTYNGNLAGVSKIKEAVKKAGGFVDAPFRFSIMWNEDGRSIVDLDAHARQPDGAHIYYSTFKGHKTPMGGMLDVDMIRPSKVGVENIFWDDLGKLHDGDYRFWIYNYDHGRNTGAKAEIFFNGETYQYLVDKEIKENVEIATLTIKNGELVAIKHNDTFLTGGSEITEEVWGIKTGEFNKVNLVCLSPNYWETKTGNKHYFFMMDGCKAPDKIRGFHNENLTPELLGHRKVMDVLGAKLLVDSTPGQLSGVGFDETVRNSVILKLKGTHNRIIKVNF